MPKFYNYVKLLIKGLRSYIYVKIWSYLKGNIVLKRINCLFAEELAISGQ
jgi:hypothetical protein